MYIIYQTTYVIFFRQYMLSVRQQTLSIRHSIRYTFIRLPHTNSSNKSALIRTKLSWITTNLSHLWHLSVTLIVVAQTVVTIKLPVNLFASSRFTVPPDNFRPTSSKAYPSIAWACRFLLLETTPRSRQRRDVSVKPYFAVKDRSQGSQHLPVDQ